MCKVTVVIPNYNGEKYLVPCLASLYKGGQGRDKSNCSGQWLKG